MRRIMFLALACGLLLSGCGSSSSLEPSGVAGGHSNSTAAATQCLQILSGVDLEAATVPELQQALHAGAITSEALMSAYLQRIATFDTKLDSIRALAPDLLEQARAADKARGAGSATGALQGIPILLKDNIGTTDMPTTAGSIALALNVPKSEASITRKLREAGAIVMGKANLSEFANWVDLRMPNGYSSLGGQVVAPYDFKLDPLGSSTGSSVAGTMAFSALTIGSETSGSIIAPSEVQSMVGVKPTLGLVSRHGIIPLAPSFDTAGPIVRNVTDAALLLGVIAGVDPDDAATARFTSSPLNGSVPDYLAALSVAALKGARLGVRSGDLDLGDPLFTAAVAVLRERGAELITIQDPQDLDSAVAEIELGAIFNEFKVSLNHYLANDAGAATPVHTLADIIAFNSMHTDKVKYGQTLLQLSDAQSGLDMDPIELAARTAAINAAQLWIDTISDQNRLDAIIGLDDSNVGVTAAAGYPDVTVPMGYEGQKPHGLEFAGKAFTEARLLALAYDYEQATKLRRPPTEINPELRKSCPP